MLFIASFPGEFYSFFNSLFFVREVKNTVKKNAQWKKNELKFNGKDNEVDNILSGR